MTWAHCNDNLKPIKIRQVEEMSNIFDRKSKDYTFFSEFFFLIFSVPENFTNGRIFGSILFN